MTASVDYGELSTNALLDALEVAGADAHPDLIRALLDRAPEVVPGLLDMLAKDPDEGWPDDDPRWYRDAHAGLLLCALREPAALPIFARLLHAYERDGLSEWYGIALPWYYGPLAVPMLVDLAQNAGTPEDARFAALDMLSLVGVHHPDQRERIAEALRALLPPLDRAGQPVLTPEERVDPPTLWTWVVNGLMSLRDEASRPQVEALFEAGVIYEYVFGGLKDYLAAFRPDAPPPLYAQFRYDILEEYESLYEQGQAEERHKIEQAQLEDTDVLRGAVPDLPQALEGPLAVGEAKRSMRAQVAPARLAGPPKKVGRNDPCPCGSGKKYKKCCGRRG
jgi:hypothetical protein